jgi:hypothetical protein
MIDPKQIQHPTKNWRNRTMDNLFNQNTRDYGGTPIKGGCSAEDDYTFEEAAMSEAYWRVVATHRQSQTIIEPAGFCISWSASSDPTIVRWYENLVRQMTEEQNND